MGYIIAILLANLVWGPLSSCNGEEVKVVSYKLPTVGISVLIRNKAHTLPYFLTCLYNLEYAKDRIYLWFYSDYNQDQSINILEKWAEKYGSEYSGVYITTNSSSGPLHRDEKGPTHWSPEHFKHVIRLREEALGFARKMWADYFFMLDADVFLTDTTSLHTLVSKGLDIVSPMLISDGLYSNFWLASDKLMHALWSMPNCSQAPISSSACLLHCLLHTDIAPPTLINGTEPDLQLCDFHMSLFFTRLPKKECNVFRVRVCMCGMTEQYYYKRTDDYKPIQKHEKRGCFDVPMVHTAVLIFLRTLISDQLTYDPRNIKNYNGPNDDIIAFAVNAKKHGVTLHVCNEKVYGFAPIPLEDEDDLKDDYEQLLNIKLEAISRSTPIPLDGFMQDYVAYPQQWKFGCDEIYMVNLERRVERKLLMDMSFKELGMDVKHFKAIDGRNLDMDNLKDMSITLMPNYEDPYHKRPMKAGEVGCFLSHYKIWQEIVDKGLGKTLVLEDDIHFVPYFRNRFLQLLRDMENFDWDLVYIGRKILLDDEEEYVSQYISKPLYSYWTLGYVISERGAQKLLDAKPLDRMLPVDEFLPIMFDQHPNVTWKAHFSNRNIQAYSAAPLLVHPTYYTGQEGYISDTEDSHIVAQNSAHVKNEL